MSSVVNETLALAALFQACTQIHRVSHTGYVDPHAAAAVIRGLIITNPQTCEDIYPSNQLLVGYRQVVASFSSQASDKNADTIEITKDAFKIIGLELTIERNAAVFNKLGNDIKILSEKVLKREENTDRIDIEIFFKVEEDITSYKSLKDFNIEEENKKLEEESS